jgi:V-type H+-transporting ATPase subunit a
VNPFQRSFVGEIRRIEEMARRVRFFTAQIERERDPISIRPLYDSAPLIAVGPRAAQTIDDLDETLNEHESRLLEMNSAYELLSERLAELIEARHVLRETAVFFRRVGASYGYHISPSIRALSFPLPPFQAESTQSEIRSSFDDSSAPLLQHEDRENLFSTVSNVQLDLE